MRGAAGKVQSGVPTAAGKRLRSRPSPAGTPLPCRPECSSLLRPDAFFDNHVANLGHGAEHGSGKDAGRHEENCRRDGGYVERHRAGPGLQVGK